MGTLFTVPNFDSAVVVKAGILSVRSLHKDVGERENVPDLWHICSTRRGLKGTLDEYQKVRSLVVVVCGRDSYPVVKY